MAFTWTIDPYGVSPLQVQLAGINVLKPKRLDIDRIIKPYEVWWRQPRTIFLGTSRFHQSLDPSILNGTRFAPAYNAALPDASLDMSIDYLRQYLRLNHNIRTVVVELFLDNFLSARAKPEPKTWLEFAANAFTLLASYDTLRDSIATLHHNASNARPTPEIRPGGYLYYPPGHETEGPFNSFAAWIWRPHYKEPYKMAIYQIDAIREMKALAQEYKLELIFLVTPNHAYIDYYYDSVGAWGLIEEWLIELSGQTAVYSVSQPNSWVYEPVTTRMTYWNDPYHFSLKMGQGILSSLAGLSVVGLPGNFMERLTPARVPSHIQARRRAVKHWAQANRSFVERFEQEREKWLTSTTTLSRPN